MAHHQCDLEDEQLEMRPRLVQTTNPVQPLLTPRRVEVGAVVVTQVPAAVPLWYAAWGINLRDLQYDGKQTKSWKWHPP
jgi:hypothetical protein